MLPLRSPRILISEPNSPEAVYLPYVWGILKTHWEHHGSTPDACVWLPPCFLRDRVERFLDEDYPDPPDILGLSCYTWNFELNCRVASWAKRRNPDCLVVAGGPDPDYKDPSFFRKHPYIDVVVVKDGEIPFTQILEAYLSGSRDFRHIGGCYLPRVESELMVVGSSHHYTGPTEVPTGFETSPYIAQHTHYERIITRLEGMWYFATWETNRGCPFRCSFCDWGSATMAKVRRFDERRVRAEAEWLGRMKVPAVFLADANFGMLPRDVEFAEHIAAVKKRYGYPQRMWYSAAKNNPDRVFEVEKRLHAADLTTEHTLAVQHTDPEVLQATERANISTESMHRLIGQLHDASIATEVQLIVGIPGDTPRKWRTAVTDMMEWGAHENYYTFAYHLLPNAPAADESYRDKWQLKTVMRSLARTIAPRKGSEPRQMKANIIVATASYSTADWCDMMTYSAFARALHNRGLTRWASQYLRLVHGIPYRDFYAIVIDDLLRRSTRLGWIQRCVSERYAWLVADEDGTDELEVEEIPGLDLFFEPTKWVAIQLCRHFTAFHEELTAALIARFSEASALRSILDYQRNMVVLPDYDSSKGKQFSIEHDWPRFFRQHARVTGATSVAEPERLMPGAYAAVPAQLRGGARSEFVYTGTDEVTRWREWVMKTCLNAQVLRLGTLPEPVIEMPQRRVASHPLAGGKRGFDALLDRGRRALFDGVKALRRG